jgi:hypothetical protein
MRNHQVDIIKFEVYSNYNSSPPNLAGGIAQLDYVESLLYYSPKVRVLFADTGSRVGGEQVGAMENDGTKFVGAEKVYLKLEDPYSNQINFGSGDKYLKVKNSRTIAKDVFVSAIQLELWSKECEDNKLEKCRVKETYQGKISDSVTSILTDVLKTQKTLDIEETINKLNFSGCTRKPFIEINNLATKCVPMLSNSFGNLAGFWFWEDSRGYHFRSIDYLMSQSAKKKYVMRDIVEDSKSVPLPAGYDGQIINAIPIKNFDIEEILETGSLTPTQMETFDPVQSKYEKNDFNAYSSQSEYIAGKEFPKLNGLENEVTKRYFPGLRDQGQYATGFNLKEQLTNSKEINYDSQQIMRQSSSRIRNMFSFKMVIKIKTDLSLHPGDMIHCDFREISLKTEQEISNKESGMFMIVTIRHKITTEGDNFSIIDLVRESIGRKPMKN